MISPSFVFVEHGPMGCSSWNYIESISRISSLFTGLWNTIFDYNAFTMFSRETLGRFRCERNIEGRWMVVRLDLVP